MAATLNHIMQDDSLAARLFYGHDYKRSLVGDSLAEPDTFMQVDMQREVENISFFDELARFFASVPWIVYAVIGVLLLALLATDILMLSIAWTHRPFSFREIIDSLRDLLRGRKDR